MRARALDVVRLEGGAQRLDAVRVARACGVSSPERPGVSHAVPPRRAPGPDASGGPGKRRRFAAGASMSQVTLSFNRTIV